MIMNGRPITEAIAKMITQPTRWAIRLLWEFLSEPVSSLVDVVTIAQLLLHLTIDY